MFNNVIDGFEENRRRRLNGDLIAIPWSSLPKLSKFLPGVQQGKYFLLGARPKSAKTQMADFLFVYEVFEWWYENRDKTNIDIKIDYFSLEMSYKAKMSSVISYKLFKDHGILISPQNLSSVFDKYILGEDIIQIIKSDKFQHWLKLFEEKVTYYDNIRNPFGIYRTIRDHKETTGKWTYKNITWDNGDGNFVEKPVKDQFIHDNPNLYHIVLTDHIGLLQKEGKETLFDAIQKYSSDYCIKMRDRYNIIPVNIQQMTAQSATAEYTMSGKLIIDKVIPTENDFGDNKHTPNDANVVMSLFWPAKYSIPEYDGWDLTRIGDNHRQLLINLNRDGICNVAVNLAFLGQCNYFKELPLEPNEKVYKQIELWNKNTI